MCIHRLDLILVGAPSSQYSQYWWGKHHHSTANFKKFLKLYQTQSLSTYYNIYNVIL
jgi:hypothetical protein